ncbi:AMP-binding protein [Streptomyces sp. NPDC048659]|uniref:AMP-binding protein n=1 Tax=Streptomyces sp. NPDC048659 TaxID=3155489 RepID=UPI00341B32CC
MTSLLDGCTPWPEEYVDHYWAAGHWRGTTLDSLLRGWALDHGPRTALVHGDTRVTYAALNRRADRMAAGLRLRGLRSGQRVIVQLPNVPELVTTLFALLRAGLVPVLCPPEHRGPEVSELVRLTQAVGYVGPATHAGFDHTAMVAEIAARGPFLRRVFTYEPPGTASEFGGGLTTDPAGCHYSPLASLDAPPEPALAQSAGQVALLLPAGAPGGGLVPRTHDDYAYQARAAGEATSLTRDDVYLAALPAGSNTVLGCPGILGTLTAGGTVVLADGPDPATCLPLIARERVTVTTVTTPVAESWLAYPGGTDTATLRLLQLTGTPPSPGTAGRAGRAFGCRVQQLFALPEGVVLLTRPEDPAEATPATHGRPLSPDDRIRVVDASGADVPDGTTGRLLARGPYTPRGHYRATAADTFTPDGYLRTPYLAHRTPTGTLVVTGPAPHTPDSTS